MQGDAKKTTFCLLWYSLSLCNVKSLYIGAKCVTENFNFNTC